eukprot:g3447.t1
MEGSDGNANSSDSIEDNNNNNSDDANIKKINTLNETVKKLKRMVTLYKKEVNRLKELVSENDKISLRYKKIINDSKEKIKSSFNKNTIFQSPLEIVGRVKNRANGPIWCLVKYDAVEDNCKDSNSEYYDYDTKSNISYIWEKEDLVTQRAKDEYDITLVKPDKISYVSNNAGDDLLDDEVDHEGGSSSQIKDLERQLDLAHDDLERLQEDFRRYRVRSEIVRRQKETEINKLMESNAEFGAQQAILDTGLEDQLSDANSRIAVLEEDNLKLKNSSKSQKADWDRLKRENQQLKQLLDSGAARGDESVAKKYQKLKQEYNAYRKRAMQLLQSKGTGGKNNSNANNDKNHSKQKGNKSDDDRGRGIDAETTLYLRNTVLQYMATDRPEVKEQMEGAIATVLRFNKKDLDFVKTKRDAARSWTNYFVS